VKERENEDMFVSMDKTSSRRCKWCNLYIVCLS
jgi:hypothetical protein